MPKNTDRTQFIKKSKRNLVLRTLVTGFTGGFVLGFIWIMFDYFNFVQFNPRVIVLRKWAESELANNWIGSGITMIMIGLTSIVIAFLYFTLFKKINSIWIGIIFGFVIWMFIFFLISLFIPEYRITKLDSDTIVSTLSLYILYGMFIGYSISYDYYRVQIDIIRYEKSSH